jgi:OmpA-OmpF porin, OOP family
MKYTLLGFAFALFFSATSAHAQFVSLGGLIQRTVEQKVDEKVQKKTEQAMDTLLQNGKNNQQPTAANQSPENPASGSARAEKSIAAYNNYDFKPGENIIFSDDFRDDQDGEFPSHWDLKSGQAVVNKVEGEPAFLLTDGNYVRVSPRMKKESYLSDPFTLEFDYFAERGAYGIGVALTESDKDKEHQVWFEREAHTSYFPNDLSGSEAGSEEDYFGHWHHAAMIYKKDQLKVYIDHMRTLVVPHCDFTPASFQICGIGQTEHPLTFKNFRVAEGGSSNTIGAMLTDGKFVTHGITFDVGKATLRPESMGVLNDVAKFLKENSQAKFEIDGHTDSDGNAASNMTLSQQRADAVKAQLVTMGIAASQLKTKGFGASKPIASNDTPEGKANNRRVEFVKQ